MSVTQISDKMAIYGWALMSRFGIGSNRKNKMNSLIQCGWIKKIYSYMLSIRGHLSKLSKNEGASTVEYAFTMAFSTIITMYVLENVFTEAGREIVDRFIEWVTQWPTPGE